MKKLLLTSIAALLLATGVAHAGNVARTDWQIEVCLTGKAAEEARSQGTYACVIVDVGPKEASLPPLTLEKCDEFRMTLIAREGVWVGPCRPRGF